MTRHEMPDLADKLFQEGAFDLASEFRSHSKILVRKGNSYRNAREDEPEMNIKYDLITNMRATLSLEKMLPVEKDYAAITFFEKLKLMSATEGIRTSA